MCAYDDARVMLHGMAEMHMYCSQSVDPYVLMAAPPAPIPPPAPLEWSSEVLDEKAILKV